MVLSKRRHDGEFVVWTPPSQAESSNQAHAVPQQPVVDEPPAKRTRVNPSRSTRYTTTTEGSPPPAKAAAKAKKPRAPRGKKAAAAASAPEPALPSPVGTGQAGPSSSQLAPPAPPAKARKGKQKADPNAESESQPEKRQAQFKPRCPQNILDRVQRVMTQRIFMIDRNRNGDELKEEFSVLGSTGNVYTVTIDHKPRCNCPDNVKGNHCKHVLFIFLKVLQVSQESGFWYQKALLTSELQQIFAEAPLAPNSLAHNHVRDAYARATGKATAPTAPDAASSGNKRIPGPDDDCPICYDGMHGASETSLVFCEECGNALHKECFGQWQRTAANSGKSLTCVWCRATWVAPRPAGAAGGAKRVAGGYLNLAGVAGVSPVRDTSTYYHGPRQGNRYYGYQNYDD
ncbi:hypothetical protein M413DRAFT_31701 [Hebeloma cylindrosporum]|uniref:SWIM-type domain-containing protein n=1 Tax=Hebeloma cylindrosporum TaxID=76867 RepID=A0A0C2XEU8_HEBCY|nr:hypothetical protein M413DRAFT_31701 [Hebeloma cylindrosporum h7]